jgi:hypothetical protein
MFVADYQCSLSQSEVFAAIVTCPKRTCRATCAGILGLNKMYWNNNTLYKKLPVALCCSRVSRI